MDRREYQADSQRMAFPKWRLEFWYGLLVVVFAIFSVRLFYLQVIKHSHYQNQAQAGQLKEYIIPAERGAIYARDSSGEIPLVLNETRYTLFADPKFITKPADYARELSAISGLKADEIEKLLVKKDTRYVVLAKGLSKDQSQQVEKLGLKGVGTREVSYRAYPQGELASQLLGFVNEEGKGSYGIEEALDKQLRGQDGLLKAITDASGVPLVSSDDNIQLDPQAGEGLVLSIDLAMQRRVEDLFKQGLARARSSSGSVVVIDPNNGQLKAVANGTGFNPAQYSKVTDLSVFSNPAFSSPLEPGSVMKPLTMAAALEQGVVTPQSSYYDPGYYQTDGYTITNVVESSGSGTRSMEDILRMSLNTGATWLLRQMGGGELNLKARQTWFEYMSSRYHFGQNTGVEGHEVSGVIPNPEVGDGLNIRFANSSFGQGMTATPLQLAAALSSVVNGGTYFQPTLVDEIIKNDGSRQKNQAKALKQNVVSPAVSQAVRAMMATVAEYNNKRATKDGYQVGGKTGTAQIAKPGGGYYEDRFNGMYVGFVGGEKASYVIVVRVDDPKIGGYAGTTAAAPVFADISQMLINDFGVQPLAQ